MEKMLKSGQLNKDSESSLRKRCVSFIVKLIEQLRQRLPKNLQMLENMELVSVQNARTALKPALTPLLKSMNVEAKQISLIESQWTSINLIDWKSTTTNDFWIEVSQYKDALDQNPFEELCNFAITILVLPHSNADIERVFSQMNIVKNKARNKMKPNMMNAILTIRAGLRRKNQSCHTYCLPAEIVAKIRTSEAYKSVAGVASTSAAQLNVLYEEEEDFSEEEFLM